MSPIVAAQWTAVGTLVLAGGAIITAVFAFLAFRKQSEEVRTLKEQASDERNLIAQQARLLEVQSGQLDVQRQQFDDQRAVNASQAKVMELQAQELRESLDERKREADSRRAAQASKVFIWEEDSEDRSRISPEGWNEANRIWRLSNEEGPTIIAHVVNHSSHPVYDVELRWHRGTTGWGEPNPEPIGMIMPDGEALRGRVFPLGTNVEVIGAVARSRDAAGVRWRLRPDGVLTDLDEGSEP